MRLSFSSFRCVLIFLLLLTSLSAEEPSSIERIHFQEIHSTQTFAKEHAQEFLQVPGKWVVFTADRQTHGVGQQGRKWVSSSEGNLYATFVTLFPKNREEELFHAMQVSAFAVVQTLQDFHLDPKIKWENDVFLAGKKISGCLCETTPSPFEDYYYFFIGIGINVNMTPEELLNVSTPATSMYAETLKVVNKEAVLSALSGHLQDAIEVLLKRGFSSFHEEIDRLLLFKGKVVEVELESHATVQGKVIGIDAAGALVLELPSQEILHVGTGRILRVLDGSSL